MLLGNQFKIGPPGHRAIVFQNLNDHRGGFEAREAGEITTGLRMPGAGQNATGLGHERKHMAGLNEIVGFGVRRHGGAYC